MINEIQAKKIEALVANEETFAKLRMANTEQEIYDTLKENGVECTYDEFTEILNRGRQAMKEEGLVNEDGELNAEALEAVNGGSARGKGILTAAGLLALCYGRPGIALICFGLAALH